MRYLGEYLQAVLDRWYTLIGALVFDLLLSWPAIRHAVKPYERPPEISWPWIVAITVMALVISQVLAGLDLLRQRDAARMQFLSTRSIVEIYATPVLVSDDVVLLGIQNIGPTGAKIKRVACAVGDRYYSDDTPFPLGPAGGANDKRDVQLTHRTHEKADFTIHQEEGVTVQVTWSDPNGVQEWKMEPPRFYSRKTVEERRKQWRIASEPIHGIARISNLNQDEHGGWHGALRLERNPDFPEVDPVKEDGCTIDLILVHEEPVWSLRESRRESSNLVVASTDPKVTYHAMFTLSFGDKPRDVRIVDQDGNCGPKVGRAGIVLFNDHAYTLDAVIMQGVYERGHHKYAIKVGQNNNDVSVEELSV